MTEMHSYLTKIIGHKPFNLFVVAEGFFVLPQEYIIRIQRGVSAENSWQVNRLSHFIAIMGSIFLDS